MESSKVRDFTVHYENRREFRLLKREIFGQHSYYMELEEERPYIIDAGAHIGLASLYFKLLYPQAEVVAIEPNPVSVKMLRMNLEENRIEGVRVVEAALAKEEGEADFYMDSSEDRWYSTAGFMAGAWNKRQISKVIRVKTMVLADLVTKPVDVLKLDVEGAEMEVLESLGKKVSLIRRMFIEHHPVEGKPLSKLLEWLERER